jgi:hypothetical protein
VFSQKVEDEADDRPGQETDRAGQVQQDDDELQLPSHDAPQASMTAAVPTAAPIAPAAVRPSRRQTVFCSTHRVVGKLQGLHDRGFLMAVIGRFKLVRNMAMVSAPEQRAPVGDDSTDSNYTVPC